MWLLFCVQGMVVMASSSFKMLKRLQVLNWQMPLNKCGRKEGNLASFNNYKAKI